MNNMNNNRFDHLFEQAARDNEQAYNRAVQDAMDARMKHMQIEHLRRERQRQEILQSDPDLLAAFHQVKRQRQAASVGVPQVPGYSVPPVPHGVSSYHNHHQSVMDGGLSRAASLDPLVGRSRMTAGATDPLLRGSPQSLRGMLSVHASDASLHAQPRPSALLRPGGHHMATTMDRSMGRTKATPFNHTMSPFPSTSSLSSFRDGGAPSLTLEQTRALVRQSSSAAMRPTQFPMPSMHHAWYQGGSLDRKISAASSSPTFSVQGNNNNKMEKGAVSPQTPPAAPLTLESAAALAAPNAHRKRKHSSASASTVSSGGKRPDDQGVGHRNDAQWLEHFEALKLYKQEHGNCVVPRGYDDNPALATWVAEQRKQYHRRLKPRQGLKKSTLNEQRLKLLMSLDFEWNAQEAAWSRHLANLLKFKAEHGHVHVPLNYREDPKLGLWVKEQRRHYGLLNQGRTSHMTADRIRILESHGFMWDTQEATWRGRLEQLKRFRDRFGHCNVPVEWDEDPSLYHWVCFQCKQYRKVVNGRDTNLTPVRIRLLSEIGFTWPTVYGKRSSVSDSVATFGNEIEDDKDENDEVEDDSSPERSTVEQAEEAALAKEPPMEEVAPVKEDPNKSHDEPTTPISKPESNTAEPDDDERTVSDQESVHSASVESPESLV